MSASLYDAVPFESRAVPLSHPDRLARSGLLAGLEPAPVQRCRVLELGCAEAANLIAMAFHLEESRFVGVDGSSAQIELGRAAAGRLGLDNLELRKADVRERSDDLGTFDYIVVHDVFSWVEEDVQARLLDLVRKHLAPEGVAYLSWDCAGGWAFHSELRRLALQRASGATSPGEKVARVRELFGVLAASPFAETSHRAAALAEAAGAGLGRRDSHLLHGYLSPTHHVFRHRDVLAALDSHELALLAELTDPVFDADVESNLLARLEERFEAGSDAEDVRDLLVGRPTRAWALCHRGTVRDELDPAVPRKVAAKAVFRAAIRPETSRYSLDADVAETFLTAGGAKVSVRNHRLKAALVEIGKHWPRALSLAEIEERTSMVLELRHVLPPETRITDEERGALTDDLLELQRLGHIEMRMHAHPVAAEPGGTPRVSALTRLEAEGGHVLTSPHHELVQINAFVRHLVGHLDGAREVDELVERMRADLDEGGLVLHGEGGAELSDEEREAALPVLVETSLKELALRSLLTA